MADAPALRVRGLTYRYPGAGEPALDRLDLEVPRGQLVLVVGRSGSGKSTLLRALNGLVPRYHGGTYGGTVEVEGMRAGRLPISELATLVGLVFQDPERQAVMSRVDNEVAFGMECMGFPPEDISGRVDSALAAVGLEGRATDLVSTLSSGQAQRLALASVLAMEPEVLALDEPTSQLDPGAAEEFLEHLERERRRRGATVLLAEHRLERGLELADRVVALEAGKLVFDGTPQEFLRTRCRGPDGGASTTMSEVFCGLTDIPTDTASAREVLRSLMGSGEVRFRRRSLPPQGPSLVRCRGVRFAYEEGIEVLRGVDLDLLAGEVLTLVGPNGSGKTTLARHLNGLLRPSAGRVDVGLEDASGRSVAELAREVALLTQNPGDYLFERTVEAELRLTVRYRGLSEEDAEREMETAVKELALEDVLDRFSWDLSAGQRQRVALGALMVGAPRVLVLDEPTRGMDSAHKASLAALARAQAATGRAVLLITHDMEFAARAADRYAVLEDGRVVTEGPPELVFEGRPGYAPLLWRATEGLDLAPDERPLSPLDVELVGRPRGGGSPW